MPPSLKGFSTLLVRNTYHMLLKVSCSMSSFQVGGPFVKCAPTMPLLHDQKPGRRPNCERSWYKLIDFGQPFAPLRCPKRSALLAAVQLERSALLGHWHRV